MNKKSVGVVIALIVLLAIFLLVVYVGGTLLGIERLQTGERPFLRFVFVVVGILIALAVYLFTRKNDAWKIGTREVVWMSIGAALYAVFSWLFNGTVFIVPSVSQVSLRPAVAIPMFFGYAFGPWVGLFTGAVGNMFGDAFTGFGLSPQWSIGNGLIGFVAGLVFLFKDRKKSLNTVLIVGVVLAALTVIIYFLKPAIANLNYYDPTNDTFGETQISFLAGAGAILIGLVLVLIVRFVFGKNIDVATAVTWGMLGNIIGIGFAAISDIWINGYSPATAIVGEFLPAAGPNLVFAAILVPLLVVAYVAVRRQAGR
jgi:uncharacterized membrane protein